MTDRVDIPEIATACSPCKIKRRIFITATRCLTCGAWECPVVDREAYDAIISGETYGICDSCRKAIKWAKKQMEGR